MGNSRIWRELISTVDSLERDGTKHRVLFVEWLTLPLQEQLRQIRLFQREVGTNDLSRSQGWARLIPQGEPDICAELFLDDLHWVLGLASQAGSGDLAE